MAFKLVKNDKATVQITVNTLNEDGTKAEPQKFMATFKKLTTDQFEQVQVDQKKGKLSDKDVVKANLKGWSEINDVNGSPLPFSDEMVDAVIADSDALYALASAFGLLHSGRSALLAKN